MKAVVITGKGGYDRVQVREWPEPPAPGAGEVRISVRAAGANFADTLARVGLYPDLGDSAPGASETDGRLREEVFGERAQHLGVHRSEVETDGASKLDATVSSSSLAEYSGECEEFEAALPIGVPPLVQPSGDSMV